MAGDASHRLAGEGNIYIYIKCFIYKSGKRIKLW